MRWAILVAMSAALAGCTAEPEPLVDNEDLILQPDEYLQLEYEILDGNEALLEVEVVAEDVVVLSVMDDLNFQAYEQGNEYIEYTDCSSSQFAEFYQSCTVDDEIINVVILNENGYSVRVQATITIT